MTFHLTLGASGERLQTLNPRQGLSLDQLSPFDDQASKDRLVEHPSFSRCCPRIHLRSTADQGECVLDHLFDLPRVAFCGIDPLGDLGSFALDSSLLGSQDVFVHQSLVGQLKQFFGDRLTTTDSVDRLVAAGLAHHVSDGFVIASRAARYADRLQAGG